ncbi:MAG: hypothetical protein LBD61_04020 [Endomicrobium sp.]|nr:hypothetical protein [Endomicrobium sp.]
MSRSSGLSILSGLNNLIDITVDEESAVICAYTRKEKKCYIRKHGDREVSLLAIAFGE